MTVMCVPTDIIIDLLIMASTSILSKHLKASGSSSRSSRINTG